MIRTDDFAKTLETLFAELVEGPPASGCYVLNAGDEGLLRSLDKLSADAASALTRTGSSIAAHVDHVRYGLSLMNRWSAGENPFPGADWAASWRKTTVSGEEWREILRLLREHRAADLAYDRAVEYANRAKACLSAFPSGRERDALIALPDYVLARDR